MTIATLKNGRGFQGVASLLLMVATLQGCATGATRGATGATGGATGGDVVCDTPEYEDLRRKSEEQPLTEQEQRRMEQLYAECVAAARGQAQQGRSSGGSKVMKFLLVIGLLAGAAYLIDYAQTLEDEGAQMRGPIGALDGAGSRTVTSTGSVASA